jgi:3-dehydroquinate dehydratase/shikimate dehydrogenase
MTMICQTVMEKTVIALRAARDAAVDADLVELRLDALDPSEIDVAGAMADRSKPVIVTCRPAWEGGGFAGSEDDRLRILREAIRCGAEYVDVEWRADSSRLLLRESTESTESTGRTTMVLSHHDFTGVPADLADRVRAMRATGAPVVKVAVMVNRLRECLTLRSAMGSPGSMEPPGPPGPLGSPGPPGLPGGHVAIAMGSAGHLTRVLPHAFGSRWTYAGAAAPGQLDAGVLAHRYRVRETGPATRVFGLAGAPVAQSASPAMHNAAFQYVGLDAVYVTFESADANEVIEVAAALGVEGLSVTAPLKSAFVQGTAMDETARAVGAVNTLKRSRDGTGAIEGRNFDGAGFLDPLERRGVDLAGRRVVVLGAGGAARSVAWALVSKGASVAISARDRARSEQLAGRLGVDVEAWPPAPSWDVLVNATPVGTWPSIEVSPIPREAVRGGLVYDLVYNPRETTLMRWARAAGLPALGGMEMLVGQACRQFEWWTGYSAERELFERAAVDYLGTDPTNLENLT